ncbi:MAG: CPBP family intramembrane glutamic endopeptidase [Kordiimonas sp.]
MIQKSTTAALEQKPSLFDFGALKDLLIILFTLVSVKQTMLLYTSMYAGPTSTTTAMLVGTYLLRQRGLSWADLGLKRPANWWITFVLAGLTFGAMAVAIVVAGSIADMFFEDVHTSGKFDHIQGNLTAYVLAMLVTWTHSAFFEELLFRAFIINRTSAFLGGGIWADVAAVIFAAVFFGYRHYYYQGMHGAITTGAIGLTFGFIYIWFGKRNIWPLVLTHGSINSMNHTARYLGLISG